PRSDSWSGGAGNPPDDAGDRRGRDDDSGGEPVLELAEIVVAADRRRRMACRLCDRRSPPRDTRGRALRRPEVRALHRGCPSDGRVAARSVSWRASRMSATTATAAPIVRMPAAAARRPNSAGTAADPSVAAPTWNPTEWGARW